MIYDCFLFANELDILEIRLATLYDSVDRFVLVESATSIAGHLKPLFYEENKKDFAEWNDKIIHVVLDDLPAAEGPPGWNLREQAMRNGIARGLDGLRPDDVVMVSDADEIISPEAVAEYHAGMGLASPDQMLFYYWLNCRCRGSWQGTRVAPYGVVRQTSPDYLRRHGYSVSTNTKTLGAGGRGGWHFSWLGGPDMMRWKLNHFLHQEVNLANYADDVWIRVAMNSGLDLFRRDVVYDFVPLGLLPERARAEKFKRLVRDVPGFKERFITQLQLSHLCDSARWRSPGVDGVNIELGCWEGLSTVVIANAIYPRKLVAVDTWHGTLDGGPAGWSVRDGFSPSRVDFAGVFAANIAGLTQGNVEQVRAEHDDFLSRLGGPVRFAHIDGDHRYEAVKRTLVRLKQLLPEGGTLCGDDFLSAGAQRLDLGGGVERAVREEVPADELGVLGNFWIWTRGQKV